MLPRNHNPVNADYIGVLSRSGPWRVAISQAGTRYLLQQERRNGFWWLKSWALDRDTLLRRLPVGVALEGLQDLPALPQDFYRPWADYEAETDAKRAQAELQAEYDRATICQDRNARLVAPLSEGQPFRLQRRTKARGWREVASDHDPALLASAVVPSRAPRPDGRPVIRSDKLADALRSIARPVQRSGPPDARTGHGRPQGSRKAG